MEKIVKELIKLKDDNYKKFNKSLCPDTKREMLGIRIPILRKFAKEIIKNPEYNFKEFIEDDNLKYFEEVILQGLVIAYSKFDFEEKLEYIKKFVPKIDSWEISDTFVPTLKIKSNYLSEYWNFILQYLYSKNEFEIRFALISILDYFLIDEYIDNVIEILNNINHDGYYVKMAVAWNIAEIAVKFNEKAMNFLKNNNLDKFTYNKAIQKMIESHRIDDKQKNILRKMKK